MRMRIHKMKLDLDTTRDSNSTWQLNNLDISRPTPTPTPTIIKRTHKSNANPSRSAMVAALTSLLLLLAVATSKSLCLSQSSSSNSNSNSNSNPESGQHQMRIAVSMPEVAKVNDAIWLNCSYSFVPASSSMAIYAIKWFKNDDEFYRFVPNNPDGNPRESIYDTPGAQVDKAKSHEGNVFLSKVELQSEAIYRCEVVCEAPSFETVRKSKQLRVYALPQRGPKIEILDANGKPKSPKTQEISYSMGDKIELRCNSLPSKPAAKLRWFVNDRELSLPPANHSTGAGSAQALSTSGHRRRRSGPSSQRILDRLRVSPQEQRQHYRGVYSSHSSLSFVLQPDDLVNNKISFKCLASMRLEIGIRSRQLVALMSPQASATATPTRARRAAMLAGGQNEEPHVRHRQRASAKQHPNKQPSAPQRNPQQSPGESNSNPRQQHLQSEVSLNELLDSAPQYQSAHLLYVYEPSDSTFGPSIVDKYDSLAAYLRHQRDAEQSSPLGHLRPSTTTTPARQLSSGANNWLRRHQHHHGSNALVKSPLYLDEWDPMRPSISWPPFESGKLVLSGPSQSIAALPLQDAVANQESNSLPASRPIHVDLSGPQSRSRASMLLHRLVQQLNCTCSDGNIDTKLGWFINDVAIDSRDTVYYATRISADHRQTTITIGLQPPASSRPEPLLATLGSSSTSLPSNRLESILNSFGASRPQSGASRVAADLELSSLPEFEAGDSFRVACQASHSMLLYSSSEMITFDFTTLNSDAHQSNSIDGLDRLAPSASQANTVISANSGWPVCSVAFHLNYIATSLATAVMAIMSWRTYLFHPY